VLLVIELALFHYALDSFTLFRIENPLDQQANYMVAPFVILDHNLCGISDKVALFINFQAYFIRNK
jgi:hypothetical protein